MFLDFLTLGNVDIKRFENFGIVVVYDKTAKEETSERVLDADIVITNKVVIDKEVLSCAKNLKLICVAATGVNNIDLNSAKEKNIAVCNVAGYSSESVVAQTFSTYFYLAHHNSYYDNYAKNKWAGSPIFTHHQKEFNNLFGKKWGIVGLGAIGKRVASVASAFGCEVVYFSTSGKNKNSEIKEVGFEELLASCDVVSIHAPLNENTKNLITKNELKKMKKTAILINMGRGGIVDESDLADALDEEVIGAAGLDVLSSEPPKKDNKLFYIKNSEKLFLSPHMAWASVEAREKLIDETYKNIESFLKNENKNRII